MEPSAHPTAGFTVRQYQPAVRDLCCRTGFLGNAVDPVFEDGDLFASFLTDYYLECEPDSAFVVTVGDAIKGVQIPPATPKVQHIPERFAGSQGDLALPRLSPGEWTRRIIQTRG